MRCELKGIFYEFNVTHTSLGVDLCKQDTNYSPAQYPSKKRNGLDTCLIASCNSLQFEFAYLLSMA